MSELVKVKSRTSRRSQPPKPTQRTRLEQLQRLLHHNLEVQQSLKSFRHKINQRMQDLDEFISTFRLRRDYTNNSALHSYIKYDRQVPVSLQEQIRILSSDNTKGNEDVESNSKQHLIEQKKKKRRRVRIDIPALPKDPKLINFRQLAISSTEANGIELYRKWFEYNRVKVPKAPFTQLQEQTIIELHQRYGNNWEKTCNVLVGRTFDDIYYEYHNRLNPKITIGRWNNRQSLMLIVLLEHFGTKSWTVIGQRMVVKSELQVRERYCNMVDPNIGKDSYWTEDMENKLMEVAPLYEYCWKKISYLPIFKNKTDNCIWRKFRDIAIMKTKEQIRQMIRDTGSRQLAEKLIKYKDIADSRTRRVSATANKIFDPNARARLNRQLLRRSRQLERSSRKDTPREYQYNTPGNGDHMVSVQESQLQYIQYD